MSRLVGRPTARAPALLTQRLWDVRAARALRRATPTLMHDDFLSRHLRAQPLVPCGAADGPDGTVGPLNRPMRGPAHALQRVPTQPLQRFARTGWDRNLAAMPWHYDCIGIGHLQPTHGSYGAVSTIYPTWIP